MIRRYLDWAHPWTNYYNAPFVGDNAPLISSRSGGHRRRLVASAANRSGAAALVAEVASKLGVREDAKHGANVGGNLLLELVVAFQSQK